MEGMCCRSLVAVKERRLCGSMHWVWGQGRIGGGEDDEESVGWADECVSGVMKEEGYGE
jgi:hypothetical protein